MLAISSVLLCSRGSKGIDSSFHLSRLPLLQFGGRSALRFDDHTFRKRVALYFWRRIWLSFGRRRHRVIRGRWLELNAAFSSP
jgi:hypothetical protein